MAYTLKIAEFQPEDHLRILSKLMFFSSARTKQVEFQRYIRRLIDLTTPNKASGSDIERFENRHNRAVPALVCPWQDCEPIVSQCVTAITKDIADRGIGLVLNQAFDAERAVVGFCFQEAMSSEPWFFLGVRRTNIAIGGGFWLLGIELTEFMNQSWHTELEPLYPIAQKLVPPRSSSVDATDGA